MGRRLYVGNLPYAGSMDSATVVREQMTGRARGFGFLEMATDPEAETAIRTLNDLQCGGRTLTVNEARPKAERTSGYGQGRPSRQRCGLH